jgi:CBS domain-containing protein
MRTINDILSTNGKRGFSVRPDSSVIDAIKQMSDEQVGALLVLNAGKLMGVVTEKDCIQKVIIKGKSPEKIQVREIMTSNNVFTTPVQSVEECLSMMVEKEIQHLQVMSNNSPVGFVSMSDLFRTIIADQKDYIYRLENYVMGTNFAT